MFILKVDILQLASTGKLTVLQACKVLQTLRNGVIAHSDRLKLDENTYSTNLQLAKVAVETLADATGNKESIMKRIESLGNLRVTMAKIEQLVTKQIPEVQEKLEIGMHCRF